MNHTQVIRISTAVFAMMCATWVALAGMQWNWLTAVISVLPLVMILGLMTRKKPLVYFYGALLSMPYLATAMTQLVMGYSGRAVAIACLATGLVFLAMLRVTLVALKHQLQLSHQQDSGRSAD